MNIKSLVFAAIAFVLSTNANAALVEIDWQVDGDASITYHSETGLQWLDVSVTASMSVNQVLASLGSGGQFEGWRYATKTDVDTLILAYNAGYSCYLCAVEMDEQVFDSIDYAVNTRDDLYIYWATTLTPFENGNYWDSVPVVASGGGLDGESANTGHFLIRDATVVPLPATVWLFASGLITLVGFTRRKA